MWHDAKCWNNKKKRSWRATSHVLMRRWILDLCNERRLPHGRHSRGSMSSSDVTAIFCCGQGRYTGTCLFAENGLSPTAILTTAVCTKNMLSFGQLQLCIMYVQAFMGLEYIRQLGMDLEGKCPSIMSHFERQQTAATSSNKQQQQHGL